MSEYLVRVRVRVRVTVRGRVRVTVRVRVRVRVRVSAANDVRLVVAGVALLVHQRVVAHVAVHEGGPDGERGRWVGLLLLLRACQQTRDVAVLPGVLERVEEANRVPVEELRARARVNGRERTR